MKVTAIVASVSALFSVSNAVCADGHATITLDIDNDGTTESYVVPINVCAAAPGTALNSATSKSYKLMCDGTTVTRQEYTDIACATANGAAASQTATNVVCSSVANCEYFHFQEWDRSSSTSAACGTPADADTAGDSIVSIIKLKGVSATVNAFDECIDEGSTGVIWAKASATNSCTAAFSGDAVTQTTYTDDQCTTGASATTIQSQGATDTPFSDGMCRYIIGCDSSTSAPSAAPSAAPTAAPVADTSAPTAAPTTASSAAQITSIMSLITAAFYVIIA